MIQHRFFLQFNSLMFDADRGRHRVALGIAASLLIGGSVPSTLWWVAVPLLLPRRAT